MRKLLASGWEADDEETTRVDALEGMTHRVALYPGSFDPVTLGHLDILERACVLFDRVVIAVLENPAKATLFTAEERLELLRQSVRADAGVEITTFAGLTVECAAAYGASVIVRGLRAVSDFETEFQMTLMNRRLAPSVDTIFLMTSFSNLFISSSIIKEVCRFGGDVAELVPPASATAMRRKFDLPGDPPDKA
ncbi:MAG TPA: pantetheine-phosphate adenylyltransferase [Candidatus Sulfotelmatobacter sp.]|nr:pantetheine-phosphate adenylyltransferase [Candidatus Sulfotelmatobacter sp.]